MTRSINAFLSLSGLVMAGFLGSLEAQTQKLLYQTDFTYVGSFRMPSGNFGMAEGTCAYSNGQVAGTVYNDPVRGKSIFITGYLSAGYVSSTPSVAQVTIPALKDANTLGINALNAGSVIQGFADPSNGTGTQALNGTGSGSVGLLCYGGKLIGTMNSAYDAGCEQTRSAWVSPLTFSQSSQATGAYAFSSPVGPRYIGGGYMTLIPAEWQSALGGKAVSGNGPWSIISCGSPGPALHVIDADLLVTQPSVSTSIPSTPLIYYEEDGIHCSLGRWSSNDPNQTINGKKIPSITVTDPHGRGTFTIAYEDNSMRVNGVLFAEGTRSVLFFGKKGLGTYCYGEGGTNGDCYDPADNSKGDHCYPYTEFVGLMMSTIWSRQRMGKKNPGKSFPTRAGYRFFHRTTNSAAPGSVLHGTPKPAWHTWCSRALMTIAYQPSMHSA